MNKTKIEYADYSSNPVTGCTKGCSYCYARRLANGRMKTLYLSNPNVAPGCDPNDPFSPRFWPERVIQPFKVKKPAKIFHVDMGDLFDSHIPDAWLGACLVLGYLAHWHTFIYLTKQIQRAAKFTFPPNAWVGITVDGYSTENWQRQARMAQLTATVRFISYEPLLSPIPNIPTWADWIIIGAMTGPGAIKPDPAWVEDLIGTADEMEIPVFLKDNLGWPVKRQEFPRRDDER